MFVSHDQNPSKKNFQKPNILRRKPKLTSIKASVCEPAGMQVVVSASTTGLKSYQYEIPKTENTAVIKEGPPQRLQLDVNVERSVENTFQENNTVMIVESHYDGLEHGGQDTVSVEAFLNSDPSTEYKTQEETLQTKVEVPSKWHIDFLNDSEKIIIEPYDESQVFLEEDSSPVEDILPATPVTSIDGSSVAEDVPNVSIEHYTARNLKFKCDAPDCDKLFLSEQKFKRHRNIHNKHSKTLRHTTSECPVRKIAEDGVEQPCGRIFLEREELLKHLNEDHTLDDAPHRCEECARRFFWAAGLRAHSRAHRARRRPALACAWPGCGRAFRLPCRLREHARAHTGDKPYPCRHPNCGWSFRTASKLRRHARRHTGERRHACACGRAFLRREHLRDHQARHAPAARAPRRCPHDGCTQSFINMSSLYLHMKKIHKKEEKVDPKTEPAEVSTIALTDVENNMFMVSFVPGAAAEREGRAARTHCTWPLAPRAPCELAPPMEQSESSESNIFTVRSDLFLHGNVLHNEDSQQMGATGELAMAAPASPLHADLGLLDTHSTIDLMQEELMYSDAAVDESSFQVLLLSGEELA